MHSADLLGEVQRAVVDRSGIDPAEVDQVVGGCVGQVGMQAANVTRTAWLQAGLPLGGRRDHRRHAVRLVAAGDQHGHRAGRGRRGRRRGRVRRRGDERGADGLDASRRTRSSGKPINRNYWEHYENTSQFEGAERIAETFGVTRAELDAFGKQSQDRAAVAWAEGRFDTQIVPDRGADARRDGEPNGTHTVTRDEGLRDTTLEALANLKPRARPRPAFHTAGTASQISDGAGALLLMTAREGRRARAAAAGAGSSTRASSAATRCSCSPGPIPATEQLLERNKLTIDDIDLVEINEAFASVVLGWQRATGADMARVNPNGGAIALGHPLGGTGAILLTKAVHELERSGKQARARHHVLRRRARHRHHPRTRLTAPQRASRVDRHGDLSC